MTHDAHDGGDSLFLFIYLLIFFFLEESERCQILNIEKVAGSGGWRLVRWLA
jgi:hypothetical protein